MASDAGHPVELYIYDLTQGLASVLSPAIIGSRIEGVWHTAIVVYDREYFYGAGGITCCDPGSTGLGAPLRVEPLGQSFVPLAVLQDYLHGLAGTTYTGNEYHLLEHNCNHFSDEVAQFLCGRGVPKHILQQQDVLPPPLRAAVTMLLSDMQNKLGVNLERRRDSPDYDTLNSQIEEARQQGAVLQARRSTLQEKEARRERRRQKKNRRDHPHLHTDMAEAVEVSELVEQLPVGGGGELEEREEHGLKEPPVLFMDFDGAAEFDALVAAIGSSELSLSSSQQQNLDELQQYLVQDEGSWVLGDDFLAFIGELLRAAEEVGLHCLRCLCACAVRPDISLVLHQDRRHHQLLTYAHQIDYLPPDHQLYLTTFMCNLFSHVSSSEWLLYISEWPAAGHSLSNIRVTTKVCVHAMLSPTPLLREAGSALLHNLAHKEVKTVVFDEVAVELCMAALQLAGEASGASGASGASAASEAGDAAEERVLTRAVKSLAALAQASREVPQLIAAIGPSPDLLRGRSPQIDEQLDIIMKTMK